MNFQPAVKDASVLSLGDLEALVIFADEQRKEHQAALVGARLGALPVKKTWADVVEQVLAPPTPPAPAKPTIAGLGAQLTYHQDAAKRLKRDLELAYEGKALDERQAKATVADMMLEANKVLAASRPPELHEVWTKEAEVKAQWAEIVRLERSPDALDWAKAQRLKPEAGAAEIRAKIGHSASGGGRRSVGGSPRPLLLFPPAMWI